MIAALGRELAPLERRVELEGRIDTGHGRFAHARLGGRRLIVGTTGDGQASARDGLESLLERLAVDRLLILGIAGGLSPGLEMGRLLVAGEVRDRLGTAPSPDRRWLERATAGEAGAGLLYTARRIAGTAAAKTRLWRDLGEPAAAAVDLETAAWARLAAERGIPYLAARAILDPAAEDLPLDFERFRDPRGRVRDWRVALRAVTRPALIGPLRELGRRAEVCADRLAAWAVDLLCPSD